MSFDARGKATLSSPLDCEHCERQIVLVHERVWPADLAVWVCPYESCRLENRIYGIRVLSAVRHGRAHPHRKS